MPLPVEVAKELATYLKGKDRAKSIWPGNWWEKSAQMFRADLAAAKIEIVDVDGGVLDFHGQRMTFISGLARAGVSPMKAQKLARHSDVNLTLRTYTHLKAEDLASARWRACHRFGAVKRRKRNTKRAKALQPIVNCSE